MRKQPDAIQQDIIDDVNASGDVFSQYTYLLQMATELPSMDDDEKALCHLVEGCQSRVWLRSWNADGLVHFTADSDTLVVRGLLCLILRIYSESRPSEIIGTPLRFLDETELGETLETSRRNGVSAIIRDIRAIASEALG